MLSDLCTEILIKWQHEEIAKAPEVVDEVEVATVVGIVATAVVAGVAPEAEEAIVPVVAQKTKVTKSIIVNFGFFSG